MTKHHAPKAFEEQPRPSCHVEDLGLRFAKALDQWNAIDGKMEVPKAVELTNELTMEALSDAAVFEAASSALGALFQLSIVAGIADRLSDMAFEIKANERAARADIARVDSALWSIRRFIEGQFGVSATVVGAEYSMPESALFGSKFKKAVAAAREPAQQFPAATSPSRVAFLVAEYERWHAVYHQASDQQEALPASERGTMDPAVDQSVRRTNDIIVDLSVTRARTLRDLGLKARIACEHDRNDLPDLTRALLLELMEINDIPPIEGRDFEPREVLPNFVEPAGLPTGKPSARAQQFLQAAE